MHAEPRRHVRLVGLEVVDEATYARYRAGMRAILDAYGGAFGVDLAVAKVLEGADVRINRVFTLSFPDCRTQECFFADEGYRAVRAAFFDQAVARVSILAEYDEAEGRVQGNP